MLALFGGLIVLDRITVDRARAHADPLVCGYLTRHELPQFRRCASCSSA